MRRLSAAACCLALLAFGCAQKARAPEAPALTSGKAKRLTPSVAVSDELVKACRIHVENAERAPKFDFDDADLLPEDRDVLEQIAKCVTNGPLKGRALSLVGRCDPRGEVEYNMVLGDFRAETVHDYLARLGVHPDAMARTTRGDLDAEGKDEEGWQRDRRVDISLQPSKTMTGIAKR